MTESVLTYISITELCRQTATTPDTIARCVEYGIIEPRSGSSSDWVFEASVISTARRALRLQRDLELDWPAIAVALELIHQRDRLQAENTLLRRRLERFLADDNQARR